MALDNDSVERTAKLGIAHQRLEFFQPQLANFDIGAGRQQVGFSSRLLGLGNFDVSRRRRGRRRGS